MAFNLRNRHFLKLDDFTPQEIGFLLQLSTELKAARYAGTEVQHLKGKQIALIFEKDSTLRSSFDACVIPSVHPLLARELFIITVWLLSNEKALYITA